MKINEILTEDLRAWFGKGKKGGAGGGGWDRYNTKGERIGKCGDSKKGEGKPKCLSKSKAASLRAKGGKKAIAAAFLMLSFVGTGSSFLAYAILDAKHSAVDAHQSKKTKSFAYLGGLTEWT